MLTADTLSHAGVRLDVERAAGPAEPCAGVFPRLELGLGDVAGLKAAHLLGPHEDAAREAEGVQSAVLIAAAAGSPHRLCG